MKILTKKQYAKLIQERNQAIFDRDRYIAQIYGYKRKETDKEIEIKKLNKSLEKAKKQIKDLKINVREAYLKLENEQPIVKEEPKKRGKKKKNDK